MGGHLASGRKSVEALSVAPVSIIHRPPAPNYLTAFQREVWTTIVARMPVDWFTAETFGLLAQYTRHVENAHRASELVEKAVWTVDDIKMLDRLTKMQDREGRAMTSIATKLRLTQQSRYNAQSASTASKAAGSALKPWEE